MYTEIGTRNYSIDESIQIIVLETHSVIRRGPQPYDVKGDGARRVYKKYERGCN